MEKRMIKVGKQYFWVTCTDGGLKLEEATADDAYGQILEETVLLDGQFSVEDNLIQKCFESAEKELIASLKNGIKGTVLAAMGFRKDSRGDGWDVDHCNGRMSKVSELIRVQLQDILKEVTVTDLVFPPEEREKILKAYKKDLIDAYRREVNNRLWLQVMDMARVDAKQVADDLIKKRTAIIGEMVLDKLVGKPKVDRS